MKQFFNSNKTCAWLLCLAVSALLFTGCETTPRNASNPSATSADPGPSEMALNTDDLVTISFSGVPTPPERYEGRIKADGHISLSFIGEVIAVGKTTAQLEKDIHDLYVPKFYNHLTVNVNTENRWFFVDGEVRTPNRLIYSGKMTVLGAIASSGGFTDFANKRKVQVIRGKDGASLIQDCKRAKLNSGLDLPVYPGDKIIVPRRLY